MSSISPLTSADRVGTSVLDLIGRTPLVRLHRIGVETPGVEIWAKAEWQNPGGSVKDRAAARMILEGEESGALSAEKTILDATSGNTGIAYAMVGAAKGYRVKLCLPSNASPERKMILRAFGAELVMTDPLDGTDGAIREARRLHASDAGKYFYPDQYSNDANWQAHYDTTGLGTSGTFVGTGRRLRKFSASIKLISFQPSGPFHGLERLKHMQSAMVPAIYDPTVADEDLRVESEQAYVMVRRLAREEGLLAGISSGAALAASLQVARRLTSGVIVTIFPDGAEKYLTEKFWDADA